MRRNIKIAIVLAVTLWIAVLALMAAFQYEFTPTYPYFAHYCVYTRSGPTGINNLVQTTTC